MTQPSNQGVIADNLQDLRGVSHLIDHHLQEDLEDFVAHSDHTLHHSWSEI